MAKRDNTAHEPVTVSPDEPGKSTTGKGVPTPSRREQEAARKRPLVPSDRKEAKRLSRQSQAEAREKARVGMAAGDDRYLTARDRGPQRRFARDYVDARFSIGELIIPALLLFIISSALPRSVQSVAVLLIWVYVLIVVLDGFLLGARVRRLVAQKFGADNVERGLRWYAAWRSAQFRMMRLPKPQVKRGQFPS